VTERPPAPGPDGLPPVQYKGADLEPARGPGLGCFWIQLALLGLFIVATPLSVSLGAPPWLSAALLFATIGLLLVAGQTIIFLLRLVAADRRAGRRRPMAGRSPTVGELEDAAPQPADAAPQPADALPPAAAPSDSPDGPPDPPAAADPPPHDPVRQ
jgi:hypothetical protein